MDAIGTFLCAFSAVFAFTTVALYVRLVGYRNIINQHEEHISLLNGKINSLQADVISAQLGKIAEYEDPSKVPEDNKLDQVISTMEQGDTT